ncbi:hypothetical protein BH02_4417 [Burkholderia pseudomallei]|nr:hypothetical protein BH02_4417 [Burkholderia pseudomallei]
MGCLQRSGTSTPGIDVSQSAAIGRRSRRRAGDARTGGRAGVRALRPRRIVAAGSAEDPRSASMRRSLVAESRNRQAASGKWQAIRWSIRRVMRRFGRLSSRRSGGGNATAASCLCNALSAAPRRRPPAGRQATANRGMAYTDARGSEFLVRGSWFVVRGSRLAIAAKKHALPHAAHMSTDRPRTDRHRAARAVPSSCVPASSRAAAAHHHGPCHMRHGAKPARPAAAASRAPCPSPVAPIYRLR